MCVCIVRHSPAWLPLYKACFHFIEPFRAPADQCSLLTCHKGTQRQVFVPRGATLQVTTSRALLGRRISMNFPRSDSSALHIPPGPSDHWRVVQGLTDLWYWNRLHSARARASDWDLECIPTVHMDGSETLPLDANQSAMRGLGGHLRSASDETL